MALILSVPECACTFKDRSTINCNDRRKPKTSSCGGSSAPETDASRVLLAATYGQMGRLDEAREQWREVIRVNPAYSVGHGRKVLPYKNPADLETVVDGLKKAGSVE